MTNAWLATVLLLMVAFSAFGQGDAITLDDELLRSAERWAQENLDDDVLRVLKDADRSKIKAFLDQLQKELQGEYIVDLAGMAGTARTILPVLERYEETLPYALWLKPRLDYLEAADQFDLIIPPPKTRPGEPPQPRPNPGPQKERELWITKLSQRPWPERSKSYVSRLKPIFAAQKVPAELVWLAEVESGFDSRARSPKGATGLFQLMPATARRYGLSTWPLDQRLKPEASAEAAAGYLHFLHHRFNDWPLALAAYNAGEGTVEELLKRRKGHTFEDIATRLPAETQFFVPKVEATLLRREGLKLSQLREPTGAK